MSYWTNDYPRMPSFWTSLLIVSKGTLTGWLTYTDWYEIRRELREIGNALWNLLAWFIAWLALLLIFLTSPVAIVVYMMFVRRQQKRVMIERKKRWLRQRLLHVCER